MIRNGVVHLVWWLFDRVPVRFQNWAEAWARTLIARRSPTYEAGIAWARKQGCGEE